MAQPKLTSKQEIEAVKRQNENSKIQFNHYIKEVKINSRKVALQCSPTYKTVDIGEQKLTAKEIVNEAEIIYKWLIKDI